MDIPRVFTIILSVLGQASLPHVQQQKRPQLRRQEEGARDQQIAAVSQLLRQPESLARAAGRADIPAAGAQLLRRAVPSGRNARGQAGSPH